MLPRGPSCRAGCRGPAEASSSHTHPHEISVPLSSLSLRRSFLWPPLWAPPLSSLSPPSGSCWRYGSQASVTAPSAGRCWN